MAVLIEATSVVVRREAIGLWLDSGWAHFLELVPNGTLCGDDDLVRVGFMTPADTEAFITSLEAAGLTFLEGNKAIDLAVVDQDLGPMSQAEWLEMVHFTLDGGEVRVTAAYLLDGSPPSPRRTDWLSAPKTWTYEGSISQIRTQHHVDDHPELELMDRRDGVDAYRDGATGKEVYTGRTQSVAVDTVASKGWPASLTRPWTPCASCAHMNDHADHCAAYPEGIPAHIRGANLAERPADPRSLCVSYRPRGAA